MKVRILTTIDEKYAEIIKSLARKNKRSTSAQIAYMLEKIIKESQ